jgi:ABC transport system ATP-binding/permease protein
MSLLTFHGVNLAFGDQTILRDASFVLEPNERVCIIGRNGAGKSTLFRLITGLQELDSGEIRKRDNLKVAQLEQTLPMQTDISVFDFVAEGLKEQQSLLERYESLTSKEMSTEEFRELDNLQRQLDAHGGWDINNQIDSIIDQLELPAHKMLSELSGGWRRRVALARTLVCKPDVLLLDEPTNHLDLEAIEWLETRIKAYTGSVMFITHDRSFLRSLATRIVDVDRGQLKSWPGDYSQYVKHKEQSLEEEERQNSLFDKKLEEEEKWIRQGVKARRTRNEGRVRALEKLRKDYSDRVKREGKARIILQDSEKSSRRVIQGKNLHYSYGDLKIIDSLSLKIMRGDRVGLIGNNGVGKSTLIKILLGELEPQQGTLKRGENLKTGYFDQLRQKLDPKLSVVDIVGEGKDYIIVNGKERHVIGYLKGFLFSPKRALTPVGYLSGGECNRVILAKLLSRATNLLVLDEPTNDLDVETLEVLEEQLIEYEGTLIVVSHDRVFLDNVVTSTLVFESTGELRSYPGGYSDWYGKGKKLAATDTLSISESTRSVASSNPMAFQKKMSTKKKLSFNLQQELEHLPEKIELLEQAISILENKIASPDFYTQNYEEIQPTLNELETHKSALEKATGRWLDLEEKT